MTPEEIEIVARAIDEAPRYLIRKNKMRTDGCIYEIVAIGEGDPVPVEGFRDAEECDERLEELTSHGRAQAAITALDQYRGEKGFRENVKSIKDRYPETLAGLAQSEKAGETEHLLNSPANAGRLRRSIAQATYSLDEMVEEMKASEVEPHPETKWSP